MTSLSDTQRILLSTASQRDSGSILPLPACLKPGGGTPKAVIALLKRCFIEERETADMGAVHRGDGDGRFGLFVTPAGLTALGIEPDGGSADAADAASSMRDVPAPPAAKTGKAAAVLALLGRPVGATMPELIAATGWLPHTTRAALTGLRKNGYVLERSKRDEVTCYTLVSAS